MKREPDPNCPICSKSSFGIPGCLVLDALQVTAARQRWQWAELGPGANDCPCIQNPPADFNTRLEDFARAGGLTAVTQPDIYRGWTIHQGRWPEPAWMAIGPNYDASYEGEEDGFVDNGEKADAPTRDALTAEIDAWFEENAS